MHCSRCRQCIAKTSCKSQCTDRGNRERRLVKHVRCVHNFCAVGKLRLCIQPITCQLFEGLSQVLRCSAFDSCADGTVSTVQGHCSNCPDKWRFSLSAIRPIEVTQYLSISAPATARLLPPGLHTSTLTTSFFASRREYS